MGSEGREEDAGDREEYTARELLVAAAAREIEDGDMAFVGMRLPLIAFQVAVSTHAPHALSIFESGVVRDDPAEGFLHTMCDLPNLNNAVSTTDMASIMARLQRGDVDVGFLGGAEIDRYGNLNTTRVVAGNRQIRLPGSGGAADIACLSGRTVILMAHEPRRFAESVEYNTSPGYGTGGDWREREGLLGGGPAALVTTKATFGFDAGGELYLRSAHPGVDAEAVVADVPWDLQTATGVGAGPVETTSKPSKRHLELIRRVDPDGFWTQ
jgi:glutaconate CoA-transferase subunit B